MALGQVIVLNGAPRSGKSTIARLLVDRLPGPWLNLGVDALQAATPRRLLPGMGLRPGGELPDLEPFVTAAYAALYDAVATLSESGIGVAVDVGHHEQYSRPLGIVQRSAARLAHVPVLYVGVRCADETVMARREATWGTPGTPDRIRGWDRAVHRPGIYDLEVDSSVLSPDECFRAIEARLATGSPGTAFTRAAAAIGET